MDSVLNGKHIMVPSVSTRDADLVRLPKSVLVAGCGYIGMRAARRFAASGIRTFAITRSEEKAALLRDEGIEPIVLELGALSGWPELPDVDLLLWSVGYERVPGVERNSVWIDGLRRLLHALPGGCDRHNSPRRILYTSSTGVYGDGAGADVDEATPPCPVTEGGRACLAAETLLKDFAATDEAEVIILRLAGIYGPDRLLRRISELRNSTAITSAPDDWLNLIHADDAVEMIQFAADSRELSNRLVDRSMIINVVASESVTRRQYYEHLAQLVNAPAPIFEGPAKPSLTAASLLTDSSSRIRGRSGNRRVTSLVRADLGVIFRFDHLEAGLRDAVDRSQLNTGP